MTGSWLFISSEKILYVAGAIDASRQTLKFNFCKNQSNLTQITQFANGVQLFFRGKENEPVEIRMERALVKEVVKAFEWCREVGNRKRTRKKSVLKRSMLKGEPQQKEHKGFEIVTVDNSEDTPLLGRNRNREDENECCMCCGEPCCVIS
uniref:Uncharacterized protein n=1 Tax=Paramoeba aestuarina TaxID=180227 RepID=A0A7S4U847_9EUKA